MAHDLGPRLIAIQGGFAFPGTYRCEECGRYQNVHTTHGGRRAVCHGRMELVRELKDLGNARQHAIEAMWYTDS